MQPDDPKLNNLKPWKKGQSGNPKGLPKGYIQTKTLITKLIMEKITVTEGMERTKKTRQEVLILKAFADALSDNNTARARTQARESLFNRLEGKPVQPIGAPLEPAVILNITPVEAML